MEAQTARPMHPLYLIAAIAVILFCAVGIAAVMGWLPTSVGKSGETAAPTIADKIPQAPAAPITEQAAAEKSPAQKPQAKPPVKSAPRPVQVARNASASAPAAANPPAAVPAAAPAPAPAPQAAAAKPKCAECGVVEAVREVEKKGEASGLGAVGGAVAGGVLGSQVGGGRGKDVMTVVGAVGGALAGHQIEKKVKSTKSYEITVRFEDGTTRTFTEPNQPAWRQGDKVKVINGQIQPNA
ncbi:MAG: glycine zipper 2TM domain-containing protein [Betaproteobacteria bacterium]|nr:glycine zipper 2TM domain-containing protein [Betaproteobacteria bacterium]MBI2960978.1 glycine zipper 2TM domain-containing protein [Betaproteobacteria bacterium]